MHTVFLWIQHHISCSYRDSIKCISRSNARLSLPYKLGELDQALKHVTKTLDLRNERDASKEMEGPLEDFDEFLKQAVNLYATPVNEMLAKGEFNMPEYNAAFF